MPCTVQRQTAFSQLEFTVLVERSQGKKTKVKVTCR